MRHSFTLIILSCAIGVGVYSLAADRSLVYSVASNKIVLTLKADCNALLKECDRLQVELERYGQEFAGFSTELKHQGNRGGFLNRATTWVKSAMFVIDGHLKSINDKYGNCMCLSAKVNLTGDLKKLVEETQQKYYQLRNRAMGLRTAIVAFRNKIQPNLN
jgi:hypothetical protein